MVAIEAGNASVAEPDQVQGAVGSQASFVQVHVLYGAHQQHRRWGGQGAERALFELWEVATGRDVSVFRAGVKPSPGASGAASNTTCSLAYWAY